MQFPAIARTTSERIESVFWWPMMLGLILLSCLSHRFDHPYWQWLVGGFYLYVALYLSTAALFKVRINWRALAAAKWALGFLGLILIWLTLQLVLLSSGERFADLLPNTAAPPWFTPDLRLTLAPAKTQWLLLSLLFVFVWLIILLAQLHSRHRLKQLFWVLTLVAVVHCVTALTSLTMGIYLFDEQQIDGHFGIARGWFVNRNHLAALLVMTSAASIAILIRSLVVWRNTSSAEKTPFRNGLCLVLISLALLLIFSVLLMSQSRAGLLAPLSIAVLFLTIAIVKGRFLTKTFSLFIAGVGICTLVLILIFGEPLISRIRADALSVGERLLQWQLTWALIREAPWFGYGGGSYGTVFQFAREFADLRQVIYNQSHNQFLHVWLEQGLIGLILWCGFIGSAIVYGIGKLWRSRSSLEQAALIGALFGILSALLQSLVDFNLQLINLLTIFICLVAIIFAAPNVNQFRRGERDSI